MKEKYYNDAVVGNKNIVTSFSNKGELLRMFYNSRDYRQFVDEMLIGVKVNDSSIIYLHDDINNEYSQYYIENTNVLNTKIKNTYFDLEIIQTDFVCIEKDILVKKYVFTNNNWINLNVNFLLYSKLLSTYNNMVSGRVSDDILMQYSHDYIFSIFSNRKIDRYRVNNSREVIKSGNLGIDKDYEGMSCDSAISYEIGNLKPGESKELSVFIYVNDNTIKYSIDEIIKEVNEIKKIDVEKELKEAVSYWKNYVVKHDGLKLLKNNNLSDEIKKIYVRSILLFPLLYNNKTGGISATIEIDENLNHCGRYSYCWPRDAIFICNALDILNMKEETTKFYKEFCKNTQSNNGMWEQRFYTDGRLAPCWGYQIDETASIIYGVYEHYKKIKDIEFLRETYQMCKKAIDSLGTFLNVTSGTNVPLNKNEEFFLKHESYDLWEMNEGLHLYSLSAIYAAYMAMAKIESVINKQTEISDKLLENANEIKDYCEEFFYSKEKGYYKRNNKDEKMDISVLGIVYPFEMQEIHDYKIKNTVEKINMTLRTYTGGYLRFENDNYIEGKNPWVISTLWMAIYNYKIGNLKEVERQIDLIAKSANEHGFLAEQIDNVTLKPKWVIGLRMVSCDVYNFIVVVRFIQKYCLI